MWWIYIHTHIYIHTNTSWPHCTISSLALRHSAIMAVPPRKFYHSFFEKSLHNHFVLVWGVSNSGLCGTEVNCSGSVWAIIRSICSSFHHHTAVTSLFLNVAVPKRNQILFCRIFQAHHRVWCAIALNFHWGRGSCALHRCIRYLCIYTSCMNPALSRSSPP